MNDDSPVGKIFSIIKYISSEIFILNVTAMRFNTFEMTIASLMYCLKYIFIFLKSIMIWFDLNTPPQKKNKQKPKKPVKEPLEIEVWLL